MDMVRKREPLLKRARAEEKVDESVAPFYYAQYLKDICNTMFARAVDAHSRQVFSCLRDSLTLKLTTCGILRGESLEKADLSDFLDFTDFQGQSDPHPIHIVMLQVFQGKTNPDHKIYGRTMRHKDYTMCAVGALGFYLWWRLDVCGEWMGENGRPDFTDNMSWYFIKLLVSSTGTDKTKSMDLQTYADAMKKVLDSVGVISSHQAHFGRKTGPVVAEMSEVPNAAIESLGNWSETTLRKFYAGRLPLMPMRAVSGWRKEEGSVYCARQTMPESRAFQNEKVEFFP